LSLNFIASIYDIFLRIKKNKKSKFEIIINERKCLINDSENFELIKREEEGSYFISLALIKNIFKKIT
jgi:sporulation protein YlmC with PRC-barrel domain